LTGILPLVADEGANRRLNRYLECLCHWAPRINLTGAGTKAAVVDVLIGPILGAERLLSPPVIDVGAGNGSPGLVLAALRPDLPFTLLEPRGKRWAFLREATRQMGASNGTVWRERSDEYRGALAGTVTMRAVGLDPRELARLLGPGGCVLVFGGPPLEGCEELRLESGASLRRRCFT